MITRYIWCIQDYIIVENINDTKHIFYDFCDAYAYIQTWHISSKERYMYIVLNIETLLGI